MATLTDVNDRKKTYKFLKSFNKMMTEQNPRLIRTVFHFGITERQVKNLVNNKTNLLSRTQTKNLKTLFQYILEHSLTIVNLSAVEKNNISVEEFLTLAKKLKISTDLINKAEKKHIEKIKDNE